MLRNYFFLCICLICSFVVQAQASDDCKNVFQITAVAGEEASPSMKSALIQYDFTQVDRSAEISIEIGPLFDCWDEDKASRFREVQTVVITPTERKGNHAVYINKLNAKCFKWRAVIKKNGCTQETPWTFQALIPNRK